MTDWNHSTPLATAGAYPQAMIPLRVEGADPTNPALDTFEQVAVASVIAAALNGMSPGQAVSIDRFRNLAAHALPATVTAFITGGFSTGGLGGGTYVADGLATAALASSYPRFCAVDSTGRAFRLMASGGAIAISQGGALGGTNNDQPAVQAAIDYAAAIGARTLLFDFDTVSIWNTVRTSAAAQTGQDAWAQDGQSLWVTAPIKFMGLPTQTHIKMLSATGTSLETGWQNVGGNVWRGAGINLIGGPQASPNANNLTFFAMENIWLDGGCAYTGVRTAVTPLSPDGPDLTHKGIRLQDTQCDEIIINNCKINGFKGEACYLAGTTNTDIWIDNTRIFGSNQSAFNPSAGLVRANNCEFGGSFISCEGLGRSGGRYAVCKFYDSMQTGITGGPANGLQYNYAYPTRDPIKAPPWLDLVDCDFHNAGQLLVGNYIRISGRATDISIALNAAVTIGSLNSTYINLDYTLDQASQNPICSLQGPPSLTTVIPGAPAGTFIPPPNDVHIRLNVHRTAHAVANGYFAAVYGVIGYIDQNTCSLAIGDADGITSILIPNFGGTSFSIPLVTCDGASASQLTGAGTPLAMSTLTMTAGPYAIAVSSPRHALVNTGTAATIVCTMAATYAYPFGQKTRIYWFNSTATTNFTFARNGTGLRLNSDCVLAVANDWIEVEFNGTTRLWHETGRQIHAA